MAFRDHLMFPPKAGQAARRCLVIGEVAQAHDGSLGLAHAFIEAIARAGADAVKFQTHIAAAERTPAEPWRIKFSLQDATRFDYWKRMEFSEEQWRGLKRHAEDLGLLFLSSPFSLEAVQMLRRIGMAAWKVASGEVESATMFDAMLATGLPMLLSSGMSGWGELDQAVGNVKRRNVPLCVLQCTTAYRCPPEKIGLNLLSVFKERYGCSAGLSDHSGTIYPGLAAVALGAEVIEVHVTLSREMFGPDVPASVTTSELAQLMEGTRFLEKAMAHPVDKDRLAGELAGMRALFTKSIATLVDLPAGAVLNENNIGLRKPGTGLHADRLPNICGRKLRRPVPAGTLITEADLE